MASTCVESRAAKSILRYTQSPPFCPKHIQRRKYLNLRRIAFKYKEPAMLHTCGHVDTGATNIQKLMKHGKHFVHVYPVNKVKRLKNLTFTQVDTLIYTILLANFACTSSIHSLEKYSTTQQVHLPQDMSIAHTTPSFSLQIVQS
jgi:hypothetical protein